MPSKKPRSDSSGSGRTVKSTAKCTNCRSTGLNCYRIPGLLGKDGKDTCVSCMGNGVQCDISTFVPSTSRSTIRAKRQATHHYERHDPRHGLRTTTQDRAIKKFTSPTAASGPFASTSTSLAEIDEGYTGETDLTDFQSTMAMAMGLFTPDDSPPLDSQPVQSSSGDISLWARFLQNELGMKKFSSSWSSQFLFDQSKLTSLENLQPSKKILKLLERSGYIVTKKRKFDDRNATIFSRSSVILCDAALRRSLSLHLIEESFRHMPLPLATVIFPDFVTTFSHLGNDTAALGPLGEILAATFMVRGSYVTNHSAVLGSLALDVPPVLKGDLVQYGDSRMPAVRHLTKRMMDLATERGLFGSPSSFIDISATVCSSASFESTLVLLEIVGILHLLGDSESLFEAKKVLKCAHRQFMSIWDDPNRPEEERFTLREEIGIFLFGRDVDVSFGTMTEPSFTDYDVTRVFEGFPIKSKYLLFPDGLMNDKKPNELFEHRGATLQMVRYAATRIILLTALAAPHLTLYQLVKVVKTLWQKLDAVYDWLEAHHKYAKTNQELKRMGPVVQEPDFHLPTCLEQIDRCYHAFKLHWVLTTAMQGYGFSSDSQNLISRVNELPDEVQRIWKESQTRVQGKILCICEILKEDMIRAPLANTLSTTIRRFSLTTLDVLPSGPSYLKTYVNLQDGRSILLKLDDVASYIVTLLSMTSSHRDHRILLAVLPLGWYSTRYLAWRDGIQTILDKPNHSGDDDNGDSYLQSLGEEVRWDELMNRYGSCLSPEWVQ